HIGPKPKLLRTSSRNGHETESNALLMSSLRSTLASFCRCSALAVCWTSIKLPWMHLPFTNALWLEEIRLGNFGAKRFARTLVTILAKLWIKLMGRKSLTSMASGTFGRRVIYAELRRYKRLTSP